MRVLYILHMFPPYKNCGSETYAVNLLTYLKSKGHDVRVLYIKSHGIKGPERMYEYKGIEVYPSGDVSDILIRWADRIITHLWPTTWAVQIAKIYHKPVYHVTHGDEVKNVIAEARYPVKIIYNAHHIAEKLNYPHPAIVLHPPINPAIYPDNTLDIKHGFITLVNLNKNKGVELFYELARLMPERKFLGVLGTYDTQEVKPLPNVTFIGPTTDMLSVYRQTRILIAPSKLESFGMAVREAMCSGIPVIVSGTPGLRENCGDAAVYCNRDKIDEWVTEIRRLDQKKYYLSRSELSKNRACNSELPEQLKSLDEFLNVG